MDQYSHIMVAIDLSEESGFVADRAAALAKMNSARLSIIHIIEPINFAYGGDIPIDLTTIQEQMDEHARTKLREFAAPYGISEENQFVMVGQPQHEIHRVSEAEAVDLVVIGSHGRHGLSLLLGSTCNSVLHGAGCDVLAVRVKSD